MTLEALAERVEALEHGGVGISVPSERVQGVDAGASPKASLRGACSPAQPVDTPRAPDAAGGAAASPSAPAAEGDTPASNSDTDEVEITPVHKPGALDRGSAKRNWQAVLVEVKKVKPARAQLFATVEVDVDADGATLVIEFPEDQAFSMQIAEEPEMRDLLKVALSRVFGFTPPFRYQLGRGAVRPPENDKPVEPKSRVDVSPETPSPSDDEPIPEYYETAVGTSPEPSARHHEPSSAPNGLDDVLNMLGARVVSEHPHESDGEDAQ
jgi:hypothetical protein